MELVFRPVRAATICFVCLVALVSIFTAILPAIGARIDAARFWAVGAFYSLCLSVVVVGLMLAGLRLFLWWGFLVIIPQSGLLVLYIWVTLAPQGEVAFRALGWLIYGLYAFTVTYGLAGVGISGFGWVRYLRGS